MQTEALTLPVVVSRLINARRHWLALQISSLLGMGPEKVRRSMLITGPVLLVSWACADAGITCNRHARQLAVGLSDGTFLQALMCSTRPIKESVRALCRSSEACSETHRCWCTGRAQRYRQLQTCQTSSCGTWSWRACRATPLCALPRWPRMRRALGAAAWPLSFWSTSHALQSRHGSPAIVPHVFLHAERGCALCQTGHRILQLLTGTLCVWGLSGSTVGLRVVQVPLLLGLGKEERALGAALDSGDADLVYLALFRMQRTLPLQQFLAVLAGKPQARALFSAYCAHTVRCTMTHVTTLCQALGVVSLKPKIVKESFLTPLMCLLCHVFCRDVAYLGNTKMIKHADTSLLW